MKTFLKACKYAIAGCYIAFCEERNFRLEVLACPVIITVGILLDISKWEWPIIFLNIGFVLSAELFNTSVERLCDLYSSSQNEKIKITKDLSAAAVLMSGIAAIVSGIIIFLPKIFQFLYAG